MSWVRETETDRGRTTTVIVVVTGDFALYHAAVSELRDRGVRFTTREPGAALPDRATVVVSAAEDGVSYEGVEHVTTTADTVQRGIEEALGLRGSEGRTVIGVDPGEQPGIAVLSGERIVRVAHVPRSEAVAWIREAIDRAADPLVRVGDGARLHGSQIVTGIENAPVEVVDETGTTPSLSVGATGAGMGDVLAAVNIARMEGERVETYDPDPTPGEIRRIQAASREQSDGDRTISERLARQVARGELQLDEALDHHREE